MVGSTQELLQAMLSVLAEQRLLNRRELQQGKGRGNEREKLSVLAQTDANPQRCQGRVQQDNRQSVNILKGKIVQWFDQWTILCVPLSRAVWQYFVRIMFLILDKRRYFCIKY